MPDGKTCYLDLPAQGAEASAEFYSNHHGVGVADRKYASSLLTPVERRIVPVLVRCVPGWLHSYELTLLTLLWSGLMLVAAAGARTDSRWLWAMSAVIVLQYLTDAVDGKIGRERSDGLVRWGYYMDHLLDYVFLSSILTGYTMLLPSQLQFLMVPALAVAAGFMVSSFLARTVTGVLTISYGFAGPIEIRLIFIAINACLATVGQSYMVAVVPYAIAAALVVLGFFVYRTQRSLWIAERQERDHRRHAVSILGETSGEEYVTLSGRRP